MGIRDFIPFMKPAPQPRKVRVEPVIYTRWTSGRRNFEGARVNRLSADAPVSNNHINEDLRHEAPTLIARARWMAQNDAYIRRGLRLIVNNVIGSGGVQLDPMVTNRGDDQLDEAVNDALRNAWRSWGKPGVFEPRGLWSFRSFDRMRLLQKMRDGESFVVLTTDRPDRRNPFGFGLHFLDPLRVPHDLNEPAPGTGNPIVMGVELDNDLRAVAYWIKVRNPKGVFQSYQISGKWYQRIDASRVIHDFDPEFAEQTRGFSGVVGAMRRVPMLDGYLEAALVAARNGASTMGWYMEGNDAVEDYSGDEDDSEDEDGDFIEEMEAGVMRKVPRGWEVQMHNPAWPNVQHGEFVKSVLRYIASDLNVGYHSLANDLENVNLSSIRHGTQEDREQYKQLQCDAIDLFHHPVYQRWIIAALGARQIKITTPNGRDNVFELNDENVERFSNIRFRARGWEFAEPLKDAQANAMNIATGIDSPQRIVESRGGDWRAHLDQLTENRRQLEERGLSVPLENISVVLNPQQSSEGE